MKRTSLFVCPHTGIFCLNASCKLGACEQEETLHKIAQTTAELDALARQRQQLSTRLEGRIVTLKARRQ